MDFSLTHDFNKILILFKDAQKEIFETIDLDVLEYVKENCDIGVNKILDSCVFTLFKENNIVVSYNKEMSIREIIKNFCETELKLM
ncbi:MAG: hypothetical protein QXN55_00255 [Candidatus Nitrosotenuis sp.]